MSTITILDGYTLNPGDLDWAPISRLGETAIFERTAPGQLLERAAGAKLLVVNKFVLGEEQLSQLPQLRCICVSATGYNNVDVGAARRRNIPVCNVVGYSTEAVAQHVFALLLALTNRVESHHRSVAEGQWSASPDFSYTLQPIPELAGRTMGIYGFGRIGQQVTAIARAFGMEVLATHKHPERDAQAGVRFVSLEELFETSDAISLHAPLTAENEQIVDARLLRRMRPGAYLINTGRGGLIHEADLRQALQEGHLAGAALDVLSQEPPPAGHPLTGLPNCLITPHLAWASQEARARLLAETAANIEAFLAGNPRNVVN